MAKSAVKTPLMKQYYNIKAKNPDAILLFRVGDFYETFEQDAVKTAEILGITLTKRANGAASYVELAGFPHHALDTYLPKLVRSGQRVAICEQLEDPKLTKKLVKRGVTELVTPGVSTNENVLENKRNNFLACVFFDHKIAGAAFLDISTGEFLVAEGNHEYIDKLVNSFEPKEILFERKKQSVFEQLFGSKFYTYPLEEWMFSRESGYERLLKQFDTASLKGFGVEAFEKGLIAAGAVLQYLDLTHHDNVRHITKIKRIEADNYVWLDKFTTRNLELLQSLTPDGKSLLDIIDRTISPMGGRLLRRWITMPLKSVHNIRERLDTVNYLFNEENFLSNLEGHIKQIGDLERLVSKIALGRILPREVIQVKNALSQISPVKKALAESGGQLLQKISQQFNPCEVVVEKIKHVMRDDPPNQMNKGNVISDGVSEELDKLRDIAHSGKDYLLKIQQREMKMTGIPSLKIGYNNVFGYYFEVTNTHKLRVPETWTRKQTLVNAERYINEELKEYEEKILTAEEKILELEASVFHNLILFISDYIEAIQLNASLIARLDCLCSFAKISKENDYVKPDINDSLTIDIREGRHPVIEKQLPVGEQYIANDVILDDKDQQIVIVTGPNMSGKSALLRQTALIVLMTQTGCFVPAKSADIGYVDKIFTRVGASDNISLGESTFMVEMNEASSILNNISPRSLILFDELGRGTSTYDGISIAWAIVEYIHEHPKAPSKTLFATHYHELNEMENSFSRIKNYNVSVRDVDGKVIFLRKLVRGGSEHSFGIHVAKLAGMPQSVVKRANTILKELEKTHKNDSPSKRVNGLAKHREGYQLSFFQLDDPVLKQIRNEIQNLDINMLTPIDALNKLNEIKRIIGVKEEE